MKRKAAAPAARILNAEAASTVALQALAHLLADDEERGRFLALTGLDLGDLRGLAAETPFHAAVLAHVIEHEPLLLAFAEASGHHPETVVAAHVTLAGPAHERDHA
jgi:hypothetical protein